MFREDRVRRLCDGPSEEVHRERPPSRLERRDLPLVRGGEVGSIEEFPRQERELPMQEQQVP